jgi:hypothetical protein
MGGAHNDEDGAFRDDDDEGEFEVDHSLPEGNTKDSFLLWGAIDRAYLGLGTMLYMNL